MKKVLIIILPLIVAVIVFIGFEYVADKTGGKGALQVTSSPQSQVYLDSNYIGKTPLCNCIAANMIKVGEHNLKLVPLGDFPPFEEQITIVKSVLSVVDRTFGKSAYSEGSIITLTLIPDSKVAQMLIISAPDGATVAIDNTPSGKAPLLVKSITESDHEIKISKDGYTDKVIRVHTIAGYQLSAKIYLGVAQNVPSNSPSLSPTPLPTQSITPTISPKVTILRTPTGFLRVRAQPSISSSEVAQVNPGDSFDLVSEQNGFYEIKLPNGQSGWVSSQYASKQ
jgi:Bacterial SH3 domain/PEGA domain